jgi:RimJ/RimL family protein N-acetyltransferase
MTGDRARVTIEPLTPATADVAAAWLADPNINQWLSGEFRDQQVVPRQLLLMASSPRNRVWSIMADEVAGGLVALSQIDTHDRSARIWYLIGRYELRGRGVASEAVRLASSRGFVELGLESISASVMAPNEASARVLVAAGFRPAGILRRGLRLGSEFVDRVLYDLVRGDQG